MNHYTRYKVADLSPIHFRKQSATDDTPTDLNIGNSRVWRLNLNGPNLQPCYRDQPGWFNSSSLVQ